MDGRKKGFIKLKNTNSQGYWLEGKLNILLAEGKWNFDLEDCDRILRIDSRIENPEAIVKLLNDNGFKCEELTD